MTTETAAHTNGTGSSQAGLKLSEDDVKRAREVIRQANAEKRKNAKPKAPRSFQAPGTFNKVEGSTWRVSDRACDWGSLQPNEVFSLTKDGLAICVKVSARKFTDLRRGKGESAIPVECYKVVF